MEGAVTGAENDIAAEDEAEAEESAFPVAGEKKKSVQRKRVAKCVDVHSSRPAIAAGCSRYTAKGR